MITAHPDIDGIWAVWDVPAEGVISAARTSNKSNLIVTTEDLGENVAINIAQGGFVKGLGAQRPYDQGVTEAKLAAYALLGKQAPNMSRCPRPRSPAIRCSRAGRRSIISRRPTRSSRA